MKTYKSTACTEHVLILFSLQNEKIIKKHTYTTVYWNTVHSQHTHYSSYTVPNIQIIGIARCLFLKHTRFSNKHITHCVCRLQQLDYQSKLYKQDLSTCNAPWKAPTEVLVDIEFIFITVYTHAHIHLYPVTISNIETNKTD